jgi:dTDP-glucose 4,6-dehydratase
MVFKRVLVTGAGGFIGSHLTEALVRRGYTVSALVRYNSLNRRGWLDTLGRDIMSSVQVIPGDIRDPYSTKDAMRGGEAVINLAALISIPYSYKNRGSYVDTNVRGTLNVLEAALELGTQKVVQTSTSEVYGTAQFVPITEDHPLVPQSPYAASKVGSDVLALSFHRSFELPVSVIRPFNTFGPRQSARAIIPTIITQFLSGTSPLRLGNTSPMRDFTFVEDTANGFISAMESGRSVGEVINLANGQEISIGALASRLAAIVGRDYQAEQDAERTRPDKSEVHRLLGSNRKADELLGWRPEVSLEDGLRRTVEWFRGDTGGVLYRADHYAI